MSRLHCSFCGKPEEAVERLVGGPRRVAICDECVALASDIVAEADLDYAGDMLLTNVGELVTNDPLVPGVAGLIPDAAVAVRKEHVVWAGPEKTLPVSYRNLPELDCEGRAVIPGFVDPHTHLVFAGDRADEFSRRLAGESYEEILEAGGGINSTVRETRSTPSSMLLEEASERAGRMLRSGTTTVEIKSGYGLETATERRMLEVAHALDQASPIDVVPTFLGAHVVPHEFLGRRNAYVELVIDEMLPACAPLAVYCDVFCEQGVFAVGEARAIFEAAAQHGLRPRLHANQLSDSGGAGLAIEVGAVSADHLDHVSEEDVKRLAEAGVVAVMLPGVSLSMRTAPPPAVRMWDAGLNVALATDCNPGTSYVDSMQFVMALAVLDAGLTADQAVWAATRGGALALEEPDKGWIGRGSLADMVILDAPSFRHIAYRPGTNLAWRVLKNGTVVVKR